MRKKQKKLYIYDIKRVIDASTYEKASRIKKLMLALPLATLMGCSAMSLQCGVDGDSSYVNLNATPKTLSQDARTMAELCSFSYQEQNNATQNVTAVEP